MGAMDAEDDESRSPNGEGSPAHELPLSSRERAHVRDLLLTHRQLIDAHQQLISQQEQLMLHQRELMSLLMSDDEAPATDEDSSGPATFLNGRPRGD